MDDYEAHHADMLNFQMQAEQALRDSVLRTLTPDEQALLAFLAGIKLENRA